MAVVGAATTFGKWGFDLFRTATSSSSPRRVYPINRNAAEVQGVKAYPTLRDLPEAIDFVVIVVPYESIPEVMQECVEIGVKAGLIISAGLGETGAEGAKLQEEIVRTARSGGIRLVGPNCMGNFNTAADFSTLRQGFIGLFIDFYFETPRRRDLDGGLKIAQDAICDALGVNDNRVVDVHLVKRIDPRRTRIEVELEAIPDWEFDVQQYVYLGEGNGPGG